MSTSSVDRLSGVSSSLAIKAPCDYTTTANITLSGLAVQAGGTWTSTLTQDDANPTRILVKNQTNAIDNGIWNPGAGTWTRAKDFDGARDVVRGTVVHVYQFDGDLWFEVSTANPIVIGTTAINFVSSTATSTLARLASTASAADGDALVGVKYVATGSAALNLHSYIEDDGAYNVMGFIDESLKAAIRNQTSTTDVDTQMQAALTAAYAESSGPFRGLYLPRGLYNLASGTTSLTFTGNRLNQALHVRGAGRNATVLKQRGTSGTLLQFTNGNPTVLGPNSCQLKLSSMMLYGNGRTMTGLGLLGLAFFSCEDINAEAFDIGVDIEASLMFQFENSTVNNNSIAFRTRNNGAGAYCNMLKFRDVITAGNSKYAYDIGHATLPSWDHCDIETCGTTTSTATVTITNASPCVVSWASHGFSAGQEVYFTTTGALPTGLVAFKGYFVLASGLGAGSFQVSATPGGAAINTSSAGSGTHTGYTASGAIVIRDTCDNEVGAMQAFIGNQTWFESNNGQGIRIEPMADASISIDKALNINQEGTKNAVVCGVIRSLAVRDFDAINTNNGIRAAPERLELTNVRVHTLDDTGVVRPTYINATTASAEYISGKTGVTATLTYTGGATSPTTNYAYRIQGKDVVLTVTSTLMTSNSTGFTATGLDTFLRPSADRTAYCVTQDNGTDSVTGVTITTAGVLNFAALKNYVVSGSKGTRVCEIRYTL